MPPLSGARRPLRSLDTEAAVLTKAVSRVAEKLALSNSELAQVLGVSNSTASRLRHGEYALGNGNKEFELGALLVRVFRGLDAIVGGDGIAMNLWLRTENTALREIPLTLIQTAQGLVQVVQYVDSRRARI